MNVHVYIQAVQGQAPASKVLNSAVHWPRGRIQGEQLLGGDVNVRVNAGTLPVEQGLREAAQKIDQIRKG
jgi:hypothetical protein